MVWRSITTCLVAAIVLESISVAVALHGPDNTVCIPRASPSTTRNVVRPSISSQYQTRIEVVIVNKNKTDIMQEYFDSINSRGFVEQRDIDIIFDAWYNFNTNEFIGYYPQAEGTPDACYVTDLSNSSQRLLFGDRPKGNGPKMFTAAGALHFGQQGVVETYMGQTIVRGINVDWWRSCLYWQSMDATMVTDWYFTSATAWDSAVGMGTQMPVQAHVKGKAYSLTSGAGHYFEHYYNFFDFKPYLGGNTQFETPAGVMCPGRKLTKGFPTVPDAFSYSMEIVNTNNDVLSFMKVAFFYSAKLVKYEYRPQKGDFSPYGPVDLVEVHDFNSGVAYITDVVRGNCSFRAIEGSDFDNRASGPNTVRIRTAKEIFYFDTKNVSYEGIKNNRGVDCDTWIASRNDYPFSHPTTSTWEWYFATNQWTQADGGSEKGAIPIQMRISVPSMGWNYIYNVYHFQKSKPDLLKFDISSCYESKKRRKFKLMIEVTNVNKVQIKSNVESFKYYVLKAIMEYTTISPLRVAHLQVFFTDNITVTFELLDVSPMVGDTQRASDYSEVSLDFAANTITQLIQNGQFIISLQGSSFTGLDFLVALPTSIVDNTTPAITETIGYNNTTPSITETTGYNNSTRATFKTTGHITECPVDLYGATCSKKCHCIQRNAVATQSGRFCNAENGTCFCNKFWSGPSCDKDVNECADHDTCANDTNAGCHNEVGGYKCDCYIGYFRNDGGYCVEDDTKSHGTPDGKASLNLIVSFDITLDESVNLRVSATFKDIAHDVKEKLNQIYWQRFGKSVVEVADITGLRRGSLIADYTLNFDQNEYLKTQVMSTVAELSKGLNVSFMDQNVTMIDKSFSDACSMLVAVRGACGAQQDCVEKSTGPVCTDKKQGNAVVVIVLSSVGSVCLLVVIITVGVYVRRRRKNSRIKTHHDEMPIVSLPSRVD